jgi:hypothetical protein
VSSLRERLAEVQEESSELDARIAEQEGLWAVQLEAQRARTEAARRMRDELAARRDALDFELRTSEGPDLPILSLREMLVLGAGVGLTFFGAFALPDHTARVIAAAGSSAWLLLLVGALRER